MARHLHLSPREETEHDTSVFMHVVVYTGIAFIVVFAAVLLILYGTKLIPKAFPAPQTSQMILSGPSPASAVDSYIS